MHDPDLVSQFEQNGGGEMPYRVKPKAGHVGTLTEPLHEMEAIHERLPVVFTAKFRVVQTQKNMRLVLNWPVLPPPQK